MNARDELARLRWRARRGMRELDELLLGFLESHGGGLDQTQRVRFATLLAATDPELCDWLLHGVAPADPALTDVIQDIRRAARP